MSRKAIPLWQVIAEEYKPEVRDKMTLKTRVYDVIAPELDDRGKSNEYNVKPIGFEKGWNVIGAVFVGHVGQVPDGAIDLLKNIPEEEAPKPKKFVKKRR